MHLHLGFGDLALLHQVILNLDSLITLELKNIADILVFDDVPVASELLPDQAELVLFRRGYQTQARGRHQGKRTFLNALRSFL